MKIKVDIWHLHNFAITAQTEVQFSKERKLYLVKVKEYHLNGLLMCTGCENCSSSLP